MTQARIKMLSDTHAAMIDADKHGFEGFAASLQEICGQLMCDLSGTRDQQAPRQPDTPHQTA